MQTSISRVFCFGLGYLARHVVSCLEQNVTAAGGTLVAHGTSRKPTHDNEFLFDDHHDLSDAACEMLQQADAVLISIPPDEQGDMVFRKYKDFLSYMPNLKWVGYCSSTAVYGDHRGNWVDETTAVNPLSVRAINRVKAEKQWQASGLPVHIFRLAGIYGAHRSALELARNHMPILCKHDHVMNRVHVEDAARAMCVSMHNPQNNAIYNLCDDLPSSREEVLRYAYEIQNLPVPAAVMWDEAILSPMARDFFEECKRVRAEITKQQLGLSWIYPDYRSGLDALLQRASDAAGKSCQMNINDNDITTRRRIAE